MVLLILVKKYIAVKVSICKQIQFMSPPQNIYSNYLPRPFGKSRALYVNTIGSGRLFINKVFVYLHKKILHIKYHKN